MSFAYIYDVVRNISFDYKDGILMSAYVQSFALPYRIELCSVMLSYYLSERILLVADLLDMFASAPVCFCFKPDIITHRFRQTEEVIIRKAGNCIHGERTA